MTDNLSLPSVYNSPLKVVVEEETVKKKKIVTSAKCKMAAHDQGCHYFVEISAPHIKCTALKCVANNVVYEQKYMIWNTPVVTTEGYYRENVGNLICPGS